MPKGLQIKDRNKTVYSDSHLAAGVDCHQGNEKSSGEHGKDEEEDLDCEPESEYDEDIE